jgi:hypothetical protein
VNYLYQKRQGDLRRYQNSSLVEIAQKNHSGFTTEDIDDIYMPRQLDLFERKLKASHDLSDNSEQEETRIRRKQFSGLSKNERRQSRSSKYKVGSMVNSKRPRHEEKSPGSKIIINYRKSNQPESMKTTIITSAKSQQTSYLEEAKKKLEEMKSSKAYYYNLNNKLKSSVTNLVKASQDLARNSEIRQRFAIIMFIFSCIVKCLKVLLNNETEVLY